MDTELLHGIESTKLIKKSYTFSSKSISVFLKYSSKKEVLLMLAFIGFRVSSVYLNLRIKVRNHLPLPMIIKPKFELGYLFQKSRHYLIPHVLMDFADTKTQTHLIHSTRNM